MNIPVSDHISTPSSSMATENLTSQSHAFKKDAPKITVIGGGTGSFTLLQALKTYTTDITALVNMADDGGSTGVLRDELGVLPPGDVRQCLVALSEAPQETRDLFNFRFPNGSLSGHSFGNLFLSAAESMTNSFEDAVRMAGETLRLTGRVLPITLDDCQLTMTSLEGVVHGQRAIELTNLPAHTYPVLTFDSPVNASEQATRAIHDADYVMIAPGNLYASLAPALIVGGISEALATTKATVVFVCNLVNKPNHTSEFTVDEYASEIERLTRVGIIDVVLYNIDIPSSSLLNRYALEHEYPVIVDELALQSAPYRAIPGRFLSHSPQELNKNDHFIKRSLIRHDAMAITEAMAKLSEKPAPVQAPVPL